MKEIDLLFYTPLQLARLLQTINLGHYYNLALNMGNKNHVVTLRKSFG